MKGPSGLWTPLDTRVWPRLQVRSRSASCPGFYCEISADGQLRGMAWAMGADIHSQARMSHVPVIPSIFRPLLDVSAPLGRGVGQRPHLVDKGAALGQRGNVFQVAHVKLLRLRDAVTTTQVVKGLCQHNPGHHSQGQQGQPSW